MQHLVDDEWPFLWRGKLVHACLFLDESENQVSSIEGSASHLAAVVAAQVLLVYGRVGNSELPCFLEEVMVIMSCRLHISFHLCCDLWGVIEDVTRHDGFSPINHEERRVANSTGLESSFGSRA